jgi:hypothetical protein
MAETKGKGLVFAWSSASPAIFQYQDQLVGTHQINVNPGAFDYKDELLLSQLAHELTHQYAETTDHYYLAMPTNKDKDLSSVKIFKFNEGSDRKIIYQEKNLTSALLADMADSYAAFIMQYYLLTN